MDPSVNSSSLHVTYKSFYMFSALFVAYIILLLPLFIFVLHVGFQRWRKQRSNAAASMSHSDVFTFHMVAQEMLGILGSCFYFFGCLAHSTVVMTVGFSIFAIVPTGQSLLHLLTCVERYLAVVHPVTYMGLKQSGGVRIRNISIMCVWLFCFAAAGLLNIQFDFPVIFNSAFLAVSSFIVCFCCLSVLCVLIRPAPGEVGGNRERVDQSKQRAFYTIMLIMGALLCRLFSSLVAVTSSHLTGLGLDDALLVVWSLLWFSLPSSLVLPLLFLHRAGKLPACKHNPGSG